MGEGEVAEREEGEIQGEREGKGKRMRYGTAFFSPLMLYMWWWWRHDYGVGSLAVAVLVMAWRQYVYIHVCVIVGHRAYVYCRFFEPPDAGGCCRNFQFTLTYCLFM